MIFINKINNLIETYDGNACRAQDNAFLYGICNPVPPLATHIIFSPMPKEVMKDMINNYRRIFPKELLVLYSIMNGADLFWSVRFVGKKNTRIPFSCFSIYGIPLTYDREHIEPFNISIEDLNRPERTPNSWLKFGSYYRPENNINRLDLFVDTEKGGVFAVEHDSSECCVAATWDSIDSCLCCVFDLLAKAKGGEDRERFSV